MLGNIMSEAEAALFRNITATTGKAVITAHSAPDGDAIGSSLALASYLRTNGVDAKIVMPDSLPDFLMWLPGAPDIVCHDVAPVEAERLVGEADTVFCLDFNDLSRIHALASAVERSNACKVMVDHHPEPVLETELRVCRPDLSSASEVVFRILWQLGYFPAMTKDEAVCIYCGMMTDTGGFAYNSSSPEIYFIISELLTKGFDKDKVYRNVYNNYSKSRVRLTGYILYNKLHFYPKLRACYYTLTGEEMKRFSFQRGDTEGLVNMPLVVKGMRLSIALREDTEGGKIRISLRSVDDFPCNKMAAEFFNGGGHLNASGGELHCTMEEAVEQVNRAVEAYAKLL